METETFVLTSDHVNLLRRANVTWDVCEFGAPIIDPKRPYGTSDVHSDMAEILALLSEQHDDGSFSPATTRCLDELHRELEIALQIVLTTGSFTPGTYVREDYGTWQPKT